MTTAIGSAPARCPYGHQLGAGRMVVGWWPCECPAALEAAGGHQTITCLACREAGWTTRRYDPPHPQTPDDVTAELAAVEHEHERAAAAAAHLAGQSGPAAERAALRLAQTRRALHALERRRARLADRIWRERQGLTDGAGMSGNP